MSGQPSAERDSWKLPLLFLILGGGFASLNYFFWFWQDGFFVDEASSVWATLAWDLNHGVFYRPLWDPQLGIGGTRYMPVFFLVYAAWMKLGFGVLAAGLLTMHGSFALLALSVYLILVDVGLKRHQALLVAALLFTGPTFQYLSVQVRGDTLAAAFSCLTVLCLRRDRLVGAGAIAVLAFFTKFTCGYLLVLAVLYLFLKGRSREAWLLAAGTGVSLGLGLVLIQLASGGNFGSNWAATATGGMTWLRLLRSPEFFVANLIRDYQLGCWYVVALLWTGKRLKEGSREVLDLFFVATTLITVFIYSSPGTWMNHLPVVQAACLIQLGRALLGGWQSQLNQLFLVLGLCSLAALLPGAPQLLPGVPSVKDLQERLGQPRLANLRAARELVPAGQPYLVGNGFVHMLEGRSAWVLDYYSLRLFLENQNEVGLKVLQQIQNHHYGAVLLDNRGGIFPRDSQGDQDPMLEELGEAFWVRQMDKRAHFSQLIRRHYRIAAVRRPFLVLYPRLEDEQP